jgi:hypothetical protein
MRENSNPVYSEAALEFGRQALANQANQRDRTGTISASSLESCGRRQQFTFMGMPELPPTSKLAAIFQNGTYMHIRWQMAGLTEGWLVEAEVPIPTNDLSFSGTMDGILYDDSVLELKSINTNGFNQVQTFGPKVGHYMQIACYMLATNRTKGVIIYEDKNTQEYSEHVVELKEDLIEEVIIRNTWIWEKTTSKTLIEPLDKCLAGEGYQYLGCPFRDRCLTFEGWGA